MANRGSRARIPIWVRVPVIIALVLAAVLLSPMVLDAAGVGVNRGSGDDMEDMVRDGGGHGSDDMEETVRDGGGHGSGDREETDRDGDGHGSGDRTERDDSGHGSRDGTDGMDH